MALPILRYHAPTKQYYVWNGKLKKRITFGSNIEVARDRYAQYLASIGGPAPMPLPSRCTVADVVGAYARYADSRYADKRERHRISIALKAVVQMHGTMPASSFKAKAARDVRSALITSGRKVRSRRYVNALMRSVQRAWRWMAAEELVPAESAASVCLVRAMGPGEGGREKAAIAPPQPGVVAPTLLECPPNVAAMLQVQLLTGARPGEICQMRWEEISRDPSQPIPLANTGRTVAAIRCGDTVVWVCAPERHKTMGRGKARVILIGPKAQAILPPVGTGLVFPTRRGTAYRADSYATAVARACRKAGVKPWSPLQLRHAAASEIAEEFDDHTAASVLGHAQGSTIINVYAEQSLRKAANAAAKCG
jgi:integrase